MESGSPGDDLAGLSPSARARPRVARLRIGVGAVIVLLILALVVAVAVSMFAPHGGSSAIPPAAAHTTGAGNPAAAADPEPTGAKLFVHVLGAVLHPGLYELSDGARVMDAVAAAGGFSTTAEQSGVNLARKLTDGEQLAVPNIGEAVPGSAPPVTGTAGQPAEKVNLNSADQAALETLPRVGPALAKRIIDWRSTNGRFTSIEDLMSVTGIGEKTFDGLKDLVTV